mgnify:FL=1
MQFGLASLALVSAPDRPLAAQVDEAGEVIRKAASVGFHYLSLPVV